MVNKCYEHTIDMVSTLPNVRHWLIGEFRDDIQFLPKYWPTFLQ